MLRAMRRLLALLDRVGRLRRRLALTLWAARTRLALRRRGCALELVAGPGAGFRRAPLIEVARGDGPGGGRVRIEIGAWCDLGAGLVLEVLPGAETRIVLGEGVRLGSGVRVIAAGGELTVGPWCDVRDGVVLKAGGRLDIGGHGVVSYQTVVHCAEAVSIAERASIGERVSIVDSDHTPDDGSAWVLDAPVRTTPVVLGRNAWIGANAVLLRGVRLGDDVVVGAGSVVRAGDYPPGWLIAGVPAVARRALTAPPDR
jgi:acetyltransferase-like isoleucine patch superfamily enzyme